MTKSISNAGQIDFTDLEIGKKYSLTMEPEIPANVDLHFNIGNNSEFFPWSGGEELGVTGHEVSFVAFSDKLRAVLISDPSEELTVSVIQL